MDVVAWSFPARVSHAREHVPVGLWLTDLGLLGAARVCLVVFWRGCDPPTVDGIVCGLLSES